MNSKDCPQSRKDKEINVGEKSSNMGIRGRKERKVGRAVNLQIRDLIPNPNGPHTSLKTNTH